VSESLRESVDNSLLESLSESIFVESESFVDLVSESLRESVDNSLLESLSESILLAKMELCMYFLLSKVSAPTQ
jgi:hypothetical protein